MNKSLPGIFFLFFLAIFLVQPALLNSQALTPQSPTTPPIQSSEAQEAALQKVFERNPEILEAIERKILDRQSLLIILTLEKQGRFHEAIPIVESVLRKGEKRLGSQHPFVAKASDYLAMLYSSAGDPRAYELNLKALKLLEKAKGPDHPDVATSLFNLAQLYKYMGDYLQAIELNIKALFIREKSLGIEHPEVADSFNELGNLASILHQTDMAYKHYYPAFLIRSKVFGPDHPITAISLNNLGNIYEKRGDFNKAAEFYNKALAIHEKYSGPNNLEGSVVLINLANISVKAGNFEKAIGFYESAIATRKNLLGANHWRVQEILPYLFVVYCSTGEITKAHDLAKVIIEQDSKFTDLVFGLSSEFQKIAFIQKNKFFYDYYFYLVSRYFSQDHAAKESALTVWLNRKGIIFDALRNSQIPKISGDTEANPILQELQEVRIKLSNVVLSTQSLNEQIILHLDARKQHLEKELSKIYKKLPYKAQIEKVEAKRIADILPEKSALIEIIDVQIPNYKDKEDAWHYLAFVVNGEKRDQIEILDLGTHDKINNKIKEMRNILPNMMASNDLKSSINTFNKLSRDLYKGLFYPIEKFLNGVEKIYLSLDGYISVLPFEILVGEKGKYLVENYCFNYLASGKDILDFGQINAQGKKNILFGNPDFDLNYYKKKRTKSKETPHNLTSKQIAWRSLASNDVTFKQLPASADEVEAIQYILESKDTELYTGERALEEALYEMAPPKILHLATHGFYLADRGLEESFLSGTERGVVITPKESFGARHKRVIFNNPLLLSGFVLAGANYSLRNGSEEPINGIITAEKITSLNLRGTDLVVLSACETGLGDFRHGEGIFGLRRAFSMAGAKSIVMSMWKVPDKETKELMVAFYSNLKAGINRNEALRQAALAQKQIVQERYGQAHPFYWGGFIFSGEP